MNATKAVERVRVMAGDRQVVSQVGMHLLGDLRPSPGPASAAPATVVGVCLAKVAVMLAGGGQCEAD